MKRRNTWKIKAEALEAIRLVWQYCRVSLVKPSLEYITDFRVVTAELAVFLDVQVLIPTPAQPLAQMVGVEQASVMQNVIQQVLMVTVALHMGRLYLIFSLALFSANISYLYQCLTISFKILRKHYRPLPSVEWMPKWLYWGSNPYFTNITSIGW